MTEKMFKALELLVKHGNGDVSHDHPTALVHGTPTINLRTALALDRLGYIAVVQGFTWQLPAGERAYREEAA